MALRHKRGRQSGLSPCFRESVIIRGLGLLADLFDGGLALRAEVCDFEAGFSRSAGLGEDGVGFAIHFLEQEVERLPTSPPASSMPAN